MPTKKRPVSRHDSAVICGHKQDIYTGRRIKDPSHQAGADCVGVAIEQARYWERENFFVPQVLDLQESFVNYGWHLVPSGGNKSTPAARREIERWLTGEPGRPGPRAKVAGLVRGTVKELCGRDNVVSLWRDYSAPEWRGTEWFRMGVQPAYLEKPERCEFTQPQGIDVLKVVQTSTAQELRSLGFPDRAVVRYTSGLLQLDPIRWGEHFRVLRRDTLEKGFCWPRLHAAHKALAQCESMEVGEQALGMLARTVVRQWKMGFEPKVQAVAQGPQKLWRYDEKFAMRWERWIKGVIGMAQTVQQFDRTYEDVWVDPKWWDGNKWETVLNRLMWWGGPLAFMMVSKSVSPFLLGMLEAQCERDRRDLLGPFLEDVILQSFRPPMPVRVAWSNDCFKDARLAWDMLKNLMERGPASLTTALERAGLDPATEAERKRDEAQASRREELMPLLMPKGNGGENPTGASRAGRQSGVPDHSAPLS